MKRSVAIGLFLGLLALGSMAGFAQSIGRVLASARVSPLGVATLDAPFLEGV